MHNATARAPAPRPRVRSDSADGRPSPRKIFAAVGQSPKNCLLLSCALLQPVRSNQQPAAACLSRPRCKFPLVPNAQPTHMKSPAVSANSAANFFGFDCSLLRHANRLRLPEHDISTLKQRGRTFVRLRCFIQFSPRRCYSYGFKSRNILFTPNHVLLIKPVPIRAFLVTSRGNASLSSSARAPGRK